MRKTFADTSYWIAIFFPRDQWHEKAKALSKSLGSYRLFTTDEVLTEFLTFCSPHGPLWRQKAGQFVSEILRNSNISVIPQTRESFLSGLNLYKNRPDKAYSLPDCISMEFMRNKAIKEVLTNDNHFRQEGFLPLS